MQRDCLGLKVDSLECLTIGSDFNHFFLGLQVYNVGSQLDYLKLQVHHLGFLVYYLELYRITCIHRTTSGLKVDFLGLQVDYLEVQVDYANYQEYFDDSGLQFNYLGLRVGYLDLKKDCVVIKAYYLKLCWID